MSIKKEKIIKLLKTTDLKKAYRNDLMERYGITPEELEV